MDAKVVTITPEQAQKLLDRDAKFYAANADVHPRGIKDHAVDQYARDMAAGRWQLNAETIKIGPGHRIMDGRHRLMACVRAGVSFRTMVANDVPHEVFATIDIGRTRTPGDLAGIAGIHNATTVAHAARILYAWEASGHTFPASFARNARPTKPEIMEAIHENEGLEDAVAKVLSFRSKSGGFLSAGIAAGLFFIFKKKDAVLAESFIEGLYNGSGLNEDEPVYHLREKLIAARLQQPGLREQAVIEYIVRAWNHTRRGTKLSKLQRGKATERETTALAAV